MKFAIITHVNHIEREKQYFGYAPYVREMNIWLKYVDEVVIVAPLSRGVPAEIDSSYDHNKIDFTKIPDFNFLTIKNILISLFKIPYIMWKIFWVMKSADHIHLRCPGNMGLLACIVQVFFPKKKKTAKYAGNWDPQSKQPWTYRLQKWILNNTFLTQNIQVLVYGEWNNQSKNIKSFFTATYSEKDKVLIKKTDFDQLIKFIFVGSLVTGKNPIYAVKIVERLIKSGNNVMLNLYGDGIERAVLQKYIVENELDKNVFLNGNQNKEVIKKGFQESHFVILPSKSEGWPKAIAEGMFWGCVPIATKVSCVPFMLDYGKRGVLMDMNLENDLIQIQNAFTDKNNFFEKSALALQWSRNYTTDVFETEIEKLLRQ
ncbi:glycosyltransferase [Flavobacterium sp. 22076]|uniref:glycosyltransferase n=1 Tax=unclassified Flavobacterium TaxID=196869 RepID=UPI003F85F1E1